MREEVLQQLRQILNPFRPLKRRGFPRPKINILQVGGCTTILNNNMERESQFNEIPIDEDISIHRADDEIDLHIPFRIRVAPDVKLASDAEVLFRGGNAWDLRELKRLHHLKQERQRLPISPLDLPEQ